ncbi:MAG: flagellar hook-length control protein FliK [Lachnospiraceae bacterium]|nr:flagellar hook-length control protein FliK [Lachnospiraceae bacterium]
MSIFLNNNFGFNKNIDNKVSEGKPAISGKISNLPDYIAALKEGSVFKGEVLDVRNNAVKILLSGNNILNARTQAGVSLNIGDILNFRVESNTGVSMLVKAISEGNSSNGLNMLMSALESANVPVNERNIALVKELVDNGQPVDKNTIKTLVSNLNSFTELDVKGAVSMYKHDIPITSDNVSQFNNYVENNNKLLNNFQSITNDIVDTLVNFDEGNNTESMLKLADSILKTLTGDESFSLESLYEQHKTELSLNGNQIDAQISQMDEPISEQSISQVDSQLTDSVKQQNTEQAVNEQLKNHVEVASENAEDTVVLKENVTEKLMPQNNTNQIFTEEFKEVLKKTIEKSLLLDESILEKPEDEIKAELEKYYKEVENKSERLMNLLENAGLEKSALYKNVNNIKANLNFMNDLNNMALYVQIPVKFNESEAHGELYVMNRHKGKVNDSDVLTAFLHLDMENLGVTDVNIRLEKGQLTTKFTLEDTVSQDIVEEHLPELKKRLEEKGYEATVLIEEVNRETASEQLSPFEKVMQLEEPKSFIKRYTLDVRA